MTKTPILSSAVLGLVCAILAAAFLDQEWMLLIGYIVVGATCGAVGFWFGAFTNTNERDAILDGSRKMGFVQAFANGLHPASIFAFAAIGALFLSGILVTLFFLRTLLLGVE
jgi:MFS family permease